MDAALKRDQWGWPTGVVMRPPAAAGSPEALALAQLRRWRERLRLAERVRVWLEEPAADRA